MDFVGVHASHAFTADCIARLAVIREKNLIRVGCIIFTLTAIGYKLVFAIFFHGYAVAFSFAIFAKAAIGVGYSPIPSSSKTNRGISAEGNCICSCIACGCGSSAAINRYTNLAVVFHRDMVVGSIKVCARGGGNYASTIYAFFNICIVR